MPDPARLKSAGIRRLRGEPRQCGQQHWLRGEPRQCSLKAPGFVAFGGSRGSAGIGRIAWLRRPWLQQANAGHPWPACARSPHHRVFRHVEARGFVEQGHLRCAELLLLLWPNETRTSLPAKDVDARGSRPSGTWMYRARVLEQDAEPRGGREPLAAAAPARSEAFALVAAAPARSQCCCPCSRGSPRSRQMPALFSWAGSGSTQAELFAPAAGYRIQPGGDQKKQPGRGRAVLKVPTSDRAGTGGIQISLPDIDMDRTGWVRT